MIISFVVLFHNMHYIVSSFSIFIPKILCSCIVSFLAKEERRRSLIFQMSMEQMWCITWPHKYTIHSLICPFSIAVNASVCTCVCVCVCCDKNDVLRMFLTMHLTCWGNYIWKETQGSKKLHNHQQESQHSLDSGSKNIIDTDIIHYSHITHLGVVTGWLWTTSPVINHS